ncbi:MAG: four helix bundle protein [Saprospiraceae bacterium]|nr:four helix bundle protein [Saprospiraceae bacterium]
MGNFKELRVRQDAIDLAEKIYVKTKDPIFSKDYGLKDQIQGASVSIASNIAEGDERGSNREAVHFFNIAKGSAAEVITQLHIALRIGYIDKNTFEELENQAERIRASLKKLIQTKGGYNPLLFIPWVIISFLKPF